MKESKLTQTKSETEQTLVATDCYVAIQSQLLNLLGKAGEATKAATTQQEIQTYGQLTRRLCHAFTGL